MWECKTSTTLKLKAAGLAFFHVSLFSFLNDSVLAKCVPVFWLLIFDTFCVVFKGQDRDPDTFES